MCEFQEQNRISLVVSNHVKLTNFNLRIRLVVNLRSSDSTYVIEKKTHVSVDYVLVFLAFFLCVLFTLSKLHASLAIAKARSSKSRMAWPSSYGQRDQELLEQVIEELLQQLCSWSSAIYSITLHKVSLHATQKARSLAGRRSLVIIYKTNRIRILWEQGLVLQIATPFSKSSWSISSSHVQHGLSSLWCTIVHYRVWLLEKIPSPIRLSIGFIKFTLNRVNWRVFHILLVVLNFQLITRELKSYLLIEKEEK